MRSKDKSVRSTYCLIFGAAIPLLPWLSQGLVIAAALVFVLISVRLIEKRNVLWAFPFFSLIAVWAISLVGFSLGTQGLSTLWAWQGLQGIYYWCSQSSLPAVSALTSLLKYFIIFALFPIWSAHQSIRQKFCEGLYFGTALASLLIIIDFFGLAQDTFTSSSFWLHLNRFGGTFSDPNAAGVFLSLLLPFVFYNASRGQRKGIVLSVLIVAAGLVTGSRSFILSLVISSFIIFKTRKSRLLLLISGTFILISLIALNQFAPTFFSSIINQMPTSMARSFEIFSDEAGNNSLFSRVTFSSLAFSVWKDHPWFGIGLDGFKQVVLPYSAKLSINLSGWTDNANSFYTGLLAELGLLGILALALSVVKLKLLTVTEQGSRLSLWILLILFVFGPHQNFVEICPLISLIMAENLEVRDLYKFKSLTYARVLVPIAAFIFIPLVALNTSLGLFDFEKATVPFRWTSVNARFPISCKDNLANFSFVVTHASESVPVNISVTDLESSTTKMYSFNEFKESQISLSCSNKLTKHVEMTVSPPWSPYLISESSDDRVLGVQLRNNNWENFFKD